MLQPNPHRSKATGRWPTSGTRASPLLPTGRTDRGHAEKLSRRPAHAERRTPVDSLRGDQPVSSGKPSRQTGFATSRRYLPVTWKILSETTPDSAFDGRSASDYQVGPVRFGPKLQVRLSLFYGTTRHHESLTSKHTRYRTVGENSKEASSGPNWRETNKGLSHSTPEKRAYTKQFERSGLARTYHRGGEEILATSRHTS